jgi:hypothetical protein
LTRIKDGHFLGFAFLADFFAAAWGFGPTFGGATDIARRKASSGVSG